MPKDNFSFEKRRKEMEKKRKAEAGATPAEETQEQTGAEESQVQ